MFISKGYFSRKVLIDQGNLKQAIKDLESVIAKNGRAWAPTSMSLQKQFLSKDKVDI